MRRTHQACGEDHYRAKLTNEDAQLIRDVVSYRRSLLDEARKISDAALAEKFGVTKSTINKVGKGHSWIHGGCEA